ncbi:alpha/beta fold hydrolase [uncultured Maribacter sp.]|uniref:alpha/beta hydrolase n=1 Tax=uncultured Maribacter sp. TaxID=431308 RepID=UPI00260F97EF|nr:alpha/beta fold hydrolase [uncultured Maribacter sp.]
MKRLKKIVLIISVLYIVIAALAYSNQEKLVFMPSRMPMNHTYDFCQSFEEFWINAEDGGKINGVHIKNESEKGVVLYFHGNSGNISHLGHVANRITEKGYDAILIDYRKFGKSSGALTENAIYEDAILAYNYTLSKYSEDKIVLYGRSFGTGVASYLAGKKKPCKLILESPFYSAVALGQHRFPFLPIDWLSNFRFPSNEFVQKVKCPVFIFHGTEDRVIPFASGKQLFDEIPGNNKKFYTIKNAGHNYLQDFNSFKIGLEEALN